jgi:copper(I)-binding protein
MADRTPTSDAPSPGDPTGGGSTAPRTALRRFLPVLLVLGAAVLLIVMAIVSPFESKPPALEVREAYVGAGSNPAGGYLVVVNDGGSDDLVGVTTSLGTVALQRRDTDPTTGDPILVPAETLRLAGYEETRLQPGGEQMLISVSGPIPEPGTTVRLELEFRVSDPIVVEAPVLSYDEIGTIMLPPLLRDAPEGD